MGKKRNHDHSASKEEKKNEDLVERLKEIVTNIDRRYNKRKLEANITSTCLAWGTPRELTLSERSVTDKDLLVGLPIVIDRVRRVVEIALERVTGGTANADDNQIVAVGLVIARDILWVDHDSLGHSRHAGRSRSREFDNGSQQSLQESEEEREESQIQTQKNNEVVIVNEKLPAGPSAPETTVPVSTEQQASLTDQDIQKQPEHETDLQEDVLNVLGPRLEPDQKKAPSLHKDIVIRWMEIFKKGLSKEENKNLVEKYNIPENCGFIAAPVLNSEVIAAVQDNVKTRDKRITEKQERIASCMAAMGKAISITLKSDRQEKLELLEILSDTGRLLAFLQREESEIRRSLILANLNSSVREILTCSTVDGFLFGANLEEKIKTAKTIERASKDLCV
ncbi:uncharacterized protein LOC124411354 [Diprion similis]|uniref:uncharacterized protein LOC124411354 n=1 Tax=Diprion similis TaxID=362088 RepID=UPI001EF7BCE3|nr:uncharacterized protein LOC124411354 [Diprion similis]